MARDHADNGTPGVEFVVGEADETLDEELPQRAPQRSPRWALAGGAVVLAAAALIAHAVSHRQEPGPTSSPTPMVVSDANESAPEGNRPFGANGIPFAAPLCQPPASCSGTDRLPLFTSHALNTAFPGMRINSSSTVLANRADKLEPDVVVRKIAAQVGDTAITVDIRLKVPIDSQSVEQHRGKTISTTKVVAIELGYVVSVEVAGPGAPVAVTTVQRLASDARLVMP